MVKETYQKAKPLSKPPASKELAIMFNSFLKANGITGNRAKLVRLTIASHLCGRRIDSYNQLDASERSKLYQALRLDYEGMTELALKAHALPEFPKED